LAPHAPRRTIGLVGADEPTQINCCSGSDCGYYGRPAGAAQGGIALERTH